MLGSTRPTVTLSTGRLKKEKLITYQRAEIAIVDRKGLEKRACECYGVIKQHLDDFAAFDTGDTKWARVSKVASKFQTENIGLLPTKDHPRLATVRL